MSCYRMTCYTRRKGVGVAFTLQPTVRQRSMAGYVISAEVLAIIKLLGVAAVEHAMQRAEVELQQDLLQLGAR